MCATCTRAGTNCTYDKASPSSGRVTEDDLGAYTSTTFGPGLIPFDARTVPDTRTYSVSAASSSSQDWESNEAVRRFVTIEQEEILSVFALRTLCMD